MGEVLTEAAPRRAETRPSFATGGVVATAVVAAVVTLVASTRYGYFGDEMYFLAAGHRLAVSYADQGPLLPLLARLMDLLAPGSLIALHVPSVLVTVAAIVASAQIARELGGSRTAQVLTAVAYSTSPFLLLQAANLSTNAFDTALWVLISWLVVRWVRTRRDSLLIWAALVTALDMQVKWLVPFLWIAIGVGVLAFGPRELLRRPALWIGAALVVVLTAPSLVWQAGHGWPQFDLAAQVAAEEAAIGGRLMFVPFALVVAGVLGVPLLLLGVWALLAWEPLRPYRFLGLVLPLLFLAFVITNGRPYYPAGSYAVAMAAGAVWWTHVRSRWRTVLTAVLAVASLLLIVSSLPWSPESRIEPVRSPADAALNIAVYGELGWPELREGVAAAYRALPEAERAQTVIVTDNYWQASALDVARDEYGLPAVYSPSRGFGYFGAPPDTATTVLWVGGDGSEPRALCASVTPAGRVDARLGFPGVSRDVTIWRCAGPRQPWSQAWPGLLRIG